MAVVCAEEKELKDKMLSLPNVAGVYIFKDDRGKILYIGKAKSLKKRVESYFSRYLSNKTQTLVSKIKDIEYIISPSEAQAQLLEATLIKHQQPPYNVDLKDDKSFPLIRITAERFPMVSLCRRKRPRPKDKALYFGPYPNAKLLRRALGTIRQIFGFRSCKRMPKQACLYYRLKFCPAPCINKISVTRYREIIKQIQMFLTSQYEDLINKLYYQMQQAAQQRRFEEATEIRNRLSALAAIRQAKPHFTPRLNVTARNESEDLKNQLSLKKLPLRIEAFDISNISGKEACGSMVSFYQGIPDKSNYRKFRIKTTESIDDYKCLSEVIQRRYSRLIRENLPLPDLVLIDGGRSHLLTAQKEIKKLGREIPVVSIAKDKENIYVTDKTHPLRLRENTAALNLIRRIRDEAHRFALAYHHVLRRKKLLQK